MWSPCRACVAVLLCAFLASAQDVPRVALLFLTHGRQQLENVWLTFLQGVADVQVPGLSEQDWAHLQEAERIERLRALLLTKGELRANSIIQDAPCFNNSMVRVRLQRPEAADPAKLQNSPATEQLVIRHAWVATCDATRRASTQAKSSPSASPWLHVHNTIPTCRRMQEATAQLKNTWRQRFTVERPRGARLADPDRAPHPVYAAQSLFSIYVHVRPDFPGYTETSVFHGREITPATWSERYRHSLGVASLLLMEAALYDTTVRNVHFAVVSESTVPLYNGGMLWLQLINEKRSRVGETHTFKELLQQDQARPRLQAFSRHWHGAQSHRTQHASAPRQIARAQMACTRQQATACNAHMARASPEHAARGALMCADAAAAGGERAEPLHVHVPLLHRQLPEDDAVGGPHALRRLRGRARHDRRAVVRDVRRQPLALCVPRRGHARA